jgi:hypothetical protein
MLSLLLLSNSAFAEPTTKDGAPVLPQVGDVGIAFDAVPVLNFALNAVTIAADTGADAGGLNSYPTGYNQVLVGKYYMTQQMAIRGRVGLNYSSGNVATDYDSPLDLANSDVSSDDVSQITDIVSESDSEIILGGGAELRRGTTRLQGFYGGEALIGFSNSKASYDYGWAYNTDAGDLGIIGNGSTRPIDIDGGGTVSFGVRGFAGVEYFVASKISIGAEYGWSIGFSNTKRGTVLNEVWNQEEDSSGTRTQEEEFTGSAETGIRVGADNGINSSFSGGTGALCITFHI